MCWGSSASKLILHAGHEYGLPLPDVSTPLSLMIIVVTLLVTMAATLAKVRRNPEVYATYDVTGRHHPPQGAELEHLREVGRLERGAGREPTVHR